MPCQPASDFGRLPPVPELSVMCCLHHFFYRNRGFPATKRGAHAPAKSVHKTEFPLPIIEMESSHDQ